MKPDMSSFSPGDLIKISTVANSSWVDPHWKSRQGIPNDKYGIVLSQKGHQYVVLINGKTFNVNYFDMYLMD